VKNRVFDLIKKSIVFKEKIFSFRNGHVCHLTTNNKQIKEADSIVVSLSDLSEYPSLWLPQVRMINSTSWFSGYQLLVHSVPEKKPIRILGKTGQFLSKLHLNYKISYIFISFKRRNEHSKSYSKKSSTVGEINIATTKIRKK
jgi:hypothetical protein